MATFVHMHINMIKQSVCDVVFGELKENYAAYCASSEEYQTQQAVSVSCTSKRPMPLLILTKQRQHQTGTMIIQKLSKC
jgi:redox-regulated HSP33 family molecular chaperone